MSVCTSNTDIVLLDPPLPSPSLPLPISTTGALDATATDLVLSTQILTMCKSALPILQKCEASKNQEKAETCVLDLIGRLAPVSCTTNDAEALSYVEAMDSTKTSSSKVQASAMQTTQRIATNVGSVKALAAAGCLAQLTKAATDSNNANNQKVATAGLAQMTKVALEGFEEAGNDLIVEIMEANANSNQSEGLANCVAILSTTDRGADALTALVSKTTANKDAKIQAVCGLASRKMAGNTTVINVTGKVSNF